MPNQISEATPKPARLKIDVRLTNMNWIKRLFCDHTPQPPGHIKSERPEGWNLTLDDLFAEMKAGKRKSVGNPEAEWAREYEKSLIPEGTRFPKKGDVYESKVDQTIHYMTAWSAPFTGDGEATLFKGERIWIDNNPNGERPIGTYALPIEYSKLEKRMVPPGDREQPKYGGFYFYFKTVDLNDKFILVQTGYNREGEPAPAGDVPKAVPEE